MHYLRSPLKVFFSSSKAFCQPCDFRLKKLYNIYIYISLSSLEILIWKKNGTHTKSMCTILMQVRKLAFCALKSWPENRQKNPYLLPDISIKHYILPVWNAEHSHVFCIQFFPLVFSSLLLLYQSLHIARHLVFPQTSSESPTDKMSVIAVLFTNMQYICRFLSMFLTGFLSSTEWFWIVWVYSSTVSTISLSPCTNTATERGIKRSLHLLLIALWLA